MDTPLTTLTPDGLEERAAIAFLELFVADQVAGRVHSLSHYLAMFEAFERRIVREWAVATGQAPIDPVPVVASVEQGRIGDYRLERELARGAQGVVYLAEDTRLGRRVALKVLATELGPLSSPALLRFRREADAIARLEHPGIATVYEVGNDGKRAWIAMRYIAGGSLLQWLERRVADCAQPPSKAGEQQFVVRIVERTARALDAAHRAGILHRDVKLANILLASATEPVLVDFGLATDAGGRTPPITLPGAVFGTLCYLAPERLAGATATVAADIYALGIVLYELLAQRRPHAAATMAAELKAIADVPAVDVRSFNPAVSRDLAIVVATAIAKEPAERYTSATALADDLARVLAMEPIAARRTPGSVRLLRWAQRNRALAASFTCLALVLVIGLAAVSWLWRDSANALADVHRLADLKLANELVQRSATLWPARAELAPEMRVWQRDFAQLCERLPEHHRRREELESSVADLTVTWELDQLKALLAVHADLEAKAESVTSRLRCADTLVRRTIEEPHAIWDAAIRRVAENPAYGGLVLRPQVGLVPLGPDHESGLEEFAHLLSGEAARRDPVSGRLLLAEVCGVVLILVPGGHAVLGAQHTASSTDGEANVDPDAPAGQTPSYTVQLDPFFLSRYEMTQAQWLRHEGRNPATFRPGGGLATITTTLHPVELISWEDTERVLRELDLLLPSEAQWEFAYRAGSHTIYPGGSDAHDLAGCENLADVTARDQGVNRRLRFIDWLDDGFLQHAPVGSFRPNRFGFHDMGGNCKEWCNDSWEDYPAAVPRLGDGLRRGRYDEYRVIRGGSFSSYLDEVTAAYRFGAQRVASGAELGVRPARAAH